MSSTSKPFYFILVTFIIVLSISFLGKSFTVFGFQFKNINIVSDLVQEVDEDTIAFVEPVVLADSIPAVPDYHSSDAIVGYEEGGGKRKKVRIAYFGDSMIEETW
ncbi:MAG: hypothetical protein IPH45_16560 [Bacteroidales bacterium]|nr:hypothetical protein [Bacteroidales bacterium]